ncbi:MAG: SpoIVB peptidase S55 domain-containing protein [Acutalibacter sp.]|jgi:stage IV sporulation protein B
MIDIKAFWKQWNKRTVSKAVRIFALSVGATALCMLGCLAFLSGSRHPKALEASVFNGGRDYSSVSASVQTAAPAASQGSPGKVIPLGTAFGIKLFTDGVIVASLSDIYTDNGVCCPAADAGIQPGDYLLTANGRDIPDNAALAQYISSSLGEPITFQVRRGDQVLEVEVDPVFGGGSFKTGMWVRDSAAGIGTLTFYDPDSGLFAGLGHGICDMDTSGVMALKSGEPAPITLSGIIKGEKNAPGQLRGYFSSDESLGTLLANKETGVFGTLNNPPSGEAVEILSREEVHTGPVQLMVCLDETGPQLYDGEIREIVNRDAQTKNLVVQVTDPRLLEKTGGIVQGMSGCPILQDGKLAGAITHVFTEDPTSGYGIFAQVLWEECQTCSDAN